MVNIGHTVKSIRVVLVGGIRGYKRKLTRSLERGEPIHRSSQQSAGARRTKKLLAKTNWFREADKEEDDSQVPGAGPQRPPRVATAPHAQGVERGPGVAQESRSSKHTQPGEGSGKMKDLKTTTVL